MNWMGAAAVIALGGVLLGGCTGVSSRKPLFSRSDMSLAQLKPGVWRIDDPDCAKPGAAKEPELCAFELVIGPDDLRPTAAELKKMQSGEEGPASGPQLKISYVLGSGEPLILQLSFPDGRTKREGEATPSMFSYAALKPLDQAIDGQIGRAEIWSVECGRQPAGAAEEGRDFDGPGSDKPPVLVSPDGYPINQDAAEAASEMAAASDAEDLSSAADPTVAVSDEDAAEVPPPAARTGGKGGPGTRLSAPVAPMFAGMKRSPMGFGCTPESADSLRAAATESHTFTHQTVTITWVRAQE